MNVSDLKENVANKAFNIEVFKNELTYLMTNWQDNPKWLSGWRHNYFCDKDGSFLTFNMETPNRHECPTCHSVYTDQKKHNAWVTIMRNKVIASMRYATLLFLKEDDPTCLSYVKKTFLFYAAHYNQFDIHLKNTILADMSEYKRVQQDIQKGITYYDPEKTDWKFAGYQINFQGPGKLMSQGLSDAVAIIRLLFCYECLQPYFSQDEQSLVCQQLLEPAIEFLSLQQFVTHNITFWREVAIQIMKLSQGEFEAEELSRPYGIYEHLESCLTEEGLWYEGSIHYHFYVAEALAYLTFFMKQHGVEDDRLEKYLTKMLQFAVDVSFDNGLLPNPNDGWPNVNLKTYLQVFELAIASFPLNYQIRKQYAHVLGLSISRFPLPIEDELYDSGYSSIGLIVLDSSIQGRLVTLESTHFNDSKMSILRNERFNVMLKYGVKSLSHAHFDPMTVEITVNNQLISKDLSNAGYGSEIVRKWYNTSLGHNSIIVNGEQNKILYTTNIEEQTKTTIHVTSNDLYKEGTHVARKVELIGDNQLQIRSQVTCNIPEKVDIVYHFDNCQFDFDRALVEPVAFDTLAEYQLEADFVHELCKVISLNTLRLDEKKQGFSLLFDGNQTEIFMMRTIGNPSEENRLSLIFRNQTKESWLTLSIKLKNKEP